MLAKMAPLWRTLTWLAAIAVLTLPVVAVVNGWVGSARWPLRQVHIQPAAGQALERVSPAALKTALKPFADAGYFAISLPAAQQALLQVPWVDSVELRKHWPDTLSLEVSEQRPFARWGEDQVLTEQGQIFPAQGVILPNGLARLDGPEAQAAEVVQLYISARRAFAADGLNVTALSQDARGSWRLQLSSGTEVILGRHDAQRRLARFARMLPGLLAEQQAPLERADLRYSNGFALLWTPPPHPAASPST